MRKVSIKTLMGVVVLCGIVMAAIRDTSGFWDGAVYTMTLAFLAFALLATMHARGKPRSAWLGACVWGGLYWALAFLPGFAETLRLPLITDRAIRNVTGPISDFVLGQAQVRVSNLQQQVSTQTAQLAYVRGIARDPNNDPAVTIAAARLQKTQSSLGSAQQNLQDTLDARRTVWLQLFPGAATATHFARTAHSLFTLLAAGLGALASAWLYRRYREQPIPANFVELKIGTPRIDTDPA